jgi:hypothetical protein
LPFIFQLNGELEALGKLPTDRDVPKAEIYFELLTGQYALQNLTQESVYSPYLRTSYQLAKELLDILAIVMQPPQSDLESQSDPNISSFLLWQIKTKYDQYRVALLSELGTLNSFFVTQKGAYDTTTLLNWGEAVFSSDLAKKVPEAIFDAKEAAKCIAYEVPTAAAFHVFRAVEATLRRYHSKVTNGAAPPKVRSIKVYVRALGTNGDPKILATLTQLADLHRNPLIHPEAAITTDEAISIVGIGRSAIAAMLNVLPVAAQTTTNVLTALT